MRKIAEVKFDHIDEVENTQTVDVLFTDNLEEYEVACEVCLDTGKIFYRDNIHRLNSEVQEAIKEIRETIKKKSPKVIAVIQGGILQNVLSDQDLDLVTIDYDFEDDPEDGVEIPQGSGKTALAYVYEGSVFEKSPERVEEILTAIKK